MINKSAILTSLVIGNQTIIIPTAGPIWFPTTWLIIVGLFILVVFIICPRRQPTHNSVAEGPFELSRIQPNYCNTNRSIEIRDDFRHDH